MKVFQGNIPKYVKDMRKIDYVECKKKKKVKCEIEENKRKVDDNFIRNMS